MISSLYHGYRAFEPLNWPVSNIHLYLRNRPFRKKVQMYIRGIKINIIPGICVVTVVPMYYSRTNNMLGEVLSRQLSARDNVADN